MTFRFPLVFPIGTSDTKLRSRIPVKKAPSEVARAPGDRRGAQISEAEWSSWAKRGAVAKGMEADGTWLGAHIFPYEIIEKKS